MIGSVRRVAALVAASGLILGLAAEPAAARTDNRSKPVVYVHGYNPFGDGTDCNSWSPMDNTLRSWGLTGAKGTFGYYFGDVNCTRLAWNHGRSIHYAPSGQFDRYVRIEHLGYRLPPYLYVEDSVTLGTPHAGTGWADWCWTTQCSQMRPGSSFVNWLATYGPNPQADGGTDWTAIGAYDDEIVSESSAISMNAAHKVQYLESSDVFHSDYYNDTTDARTADVRYQDNGGAWYTWYDAPWGVRWSDYAMLYGSW